MIFFTRSHALIIGTAIIIFLNFIFLHGLKHGGKSLAPFGSH